MKDIKEVLTMEQLDSLITKACNSTDIAHKTKVKLRKIIQNETFEYLNSEHSDLRKVIDILWSEQPKDAVVIKLINEWKLEGLKVIEGENLVIKIIDKENFCDETRRSFLGSYDYIVEVYLKGYTTILSKDFSMAECNEPLVSCGCLMYRADSTIGEIGEVLNSYGKRIYSSAEEFCKINKIGLEVTEKLLKVAEVHYLLTMNIMKDCNKRLVEGSNYVEIVDSLKSLYEQEMKIKPREKGFRFYLEGIFEIYNLHSDDILMIHLAEYVVSEKQKNIDFIQEAKDKQQKVIDITPHQKLSIETTTANAEESKKDEIIDFVKDINPCIEFDNLFGTDFEDKIEIWNYMLFFKMIDKNGTYLSIGNNTIIRVFVVIMRKHFKLPIAKSVDELIRIFGIKLSISDTVRVRSTPEIELKEQEIIRLLNAFETKTLPFTYVD